MPNKKTFDDDNLENLGENDGLDEGLNEELFEELLIEEELNEKSDDDFYFDDDIDVEIDEEEKVTSNINQDDSESELDIYFKYNTNNHKLEGKHSLKRDTILNGKLNSTSDLDENQYITSYYDSAGNNLEMDSYEYGFDNLSLERGSVFEDESKRNDEMLNKRKLSEDVYNLLKTNTDLDFTVNRRKPNKIIFNNYYRMLLCNMNKQYSKSEIFVELSYYFTDNIFNMYKLLDKKYAT